MNLVRNVVAAVCVFASASASAIPVTLNGVSGTWSAWEGNDDVRSYDDGVEIRWGGAGQSRSQKSGYRFDAAENLPFTFDSDNTFSLGTFTHFNMPIPEDTAISSATLTVSTELDILDTSVTDGPYDFQFSHDETLNNAEVKYWVCIWIFCGKITTHTGDVNDIVYFDNAISSNEFTVDSYAFQLEVLGFEKIETTTVTYMDELSTREGEATSAEIIARLNVRTIPQQVTEPASIALLGISLLGLVLLRRRDA